VESLKTLIRHSFTGNGGEMEWEGGWGARKSPGVLTTMFYVSFIFPHMLHAQPNRSSVIC